MQGGGLLETTRGIVPAVASGLEGERFPRTLAGKTLALAIVRSLKKTISSSETAYSAAGQESEPLV
jgi:hypothetical protein